MQPLLLLVHRIPYPPNKGDKIRSYHLLKYLVAHFDVYLGAFVDEDDDWRHRADLERHCREVFLRRRPGIRAWPRMLLGLLGRAPLTMPYYHDAGMVGWVRDVVAREGIRRAVVYSSAMAQYVRGSAWHHLFRVIDFVDVDSDKWRQYARHRSFPASLIYGREARCLQRCEARIASEFDLSVFVSEREARHFQQLTGVPEEKVGFYNNGVDLEYFDPDRPFENPYEEGERAIVFTGAMDYWANVDAVVWFCQDVLGSVRMRFPQAVFYIVGSNPVSRVAALGGRPGVKVTGKVPDVRPYLAHAAVSVAPLRIARGIQNKVLESMAMRLPVIATEAAAEGIDARHGRDLCVENDPKAMADRIVEILRHGGEEYGRAARACIERNYDWDVSLRAFVAEIQRRFGDD